VNHLNPFRMPASEISENIAKLAREPYEIDPALWLVYGRLRQDAPLAQDQSTAEIPEPDGPRTSQRFRSWVAAACVPITLAAAVGIGISLPQHTPEPAAQARVPAAPPLVIADPAPIPVRPDRPTPQMQQWSRSRSIPASHPVIQHHRRAGAGAHHHRQSVAQAPSEAPWTSGCPASLGPACGNRP